MKTTLLVAFLCWLVLGAYEAQAQEYTYWDAAQYQHAQQYDPYYELHVIHYQLYLQQYPPYQVYQPCCFVGGVIPGWTAPIVTVPQVVIPPRPRAFKRR